MLFKLRVACSPRGVFERMGERENAGKEKDIRRVFFQESTPNAFRVPVKKSAKNTLGVFFPQRAHAEKSHTQKERDEKSV